MNQILLNKGAYQNDITEWVFNKIGEIKITEQAVKLVIYLYYHNLFFTHDC